MKPAVSIINAVKSPFNLSVLVVLIFGGAFLSGVDTETPKWALLIGVIFVWLVVVISDYFKVKKLAKSEDLDEVVNSLKSKINTLESTISGLDAELESKSQKLVKYESEALKSEVRSYFSSSDDRSVDEAVKSFLSNPQNQSREQAFRVTVGRMEKNGELFYYYTNGKLRLKEPT